MSGSFEGVLEATDDDHRGKCDAYFLCLPHGTSAEKARELLDGKARVIDLSADFRFEDCHTTKRIMSGTKHPNCGSKPYTVFLNSTGSK